MGNLDSLPVEIILEILKRVDIDSVIQYRLVSRSWNYLAYHLLLDHLKETQMEFQRKAKEIEVKCSLSGRVDEIKPQNDRMLCTMSICFRILEGAMEFIKVIMELINKVRLEIETLKISGEFGEYRMLLLLKNFTDTDLKRYLNCLHSTECVEWLELLDCAQSLIERIEYLIEKLKQQQSTYLASGIRVLHQACAGPFAILFIFLFLRFILLVIAMTT